MGRPLNLFAPAMKRCCFLLSFLFCNLVTQGQGVPEKLALPAFEINVAHCPLRLDDPAVYHTKVQRLPDSALRVAISNVVKAYYLEASSGDSTETYFKLKDVYITTISLPDSMNIVYVVLLRHPATGQVNSKILFYNHNQQRIVGTPLDFNLHALYEYDGNRLVASNLKKQLGIKEPEIDRVDYNNDGVPDYRLTRLFHNGTYNKIQQTIVNVAATQIDTLHIEEQVVGNKD